MSPWVLVLVLSIYRAGVAVEEIPMSSAASCHAAIEEIKSSRYIDEAYCFPR